MLYDRQGRARATIVYCVVVMCVRQDNFDVRRDYGGSFTQFVEQLVKEGLVMIESQRNTTLLRDVPSMQEEVRDFCLERAGASIWSCEGAELHCASPARLLICDICASH